MGGNLKKRERGGEEKRGEEKRGEERRGHRGHRAPGPILDRAKPLAPNPPALSIPIPAWDGDRWQRGAWRRCQRPPPPFSSAPSSPWQGRGRWRRQLAGRRALPAGREPVPSVLARGELGELPKNRGCGLRATAPHRPGGSKPPHPPLPTPQSLAVPPPPRPNPCWFFVGIAAEARFKAENEVLQMLAGNSSQSLLERCSGERPRARPFRCGTGIRTT